MKLLRMSMALGVSLLWTAPYACASGDSNLHTVGASGFNGSSFSFLGGHNLGPLSGQVLNPSITASNTTTTGGGSANNWTSSTTFGPATLAQVSAQPAFGPPPGLLSGANLAISARARQRLPLGDNTANGACGLFGGAAAKITALDLALNNGQMPYLGLPVTPLALYTAGRSLAVRLQSQQWAAGPTTPTTTLATDLERRLAEKHLSLTQALGTVVGSMRFHNGDILTCGTSGTLHLAADNSGSLTFNDGEVVTFTQVDPCLKRIALQSTLIF